MKKLWESSPVRFVREMVSLYFSRHVSRSSAELAYFLILTFFPILICINAFVGTLQISTQTILVSLRPFLPPGMLAVVSDYVAYISANNSTALLIAGVAMTLFPASAAMRSLMNVMGEIYGVQRYRGLVGIVASVIFSLLLLVTIYLSLVVVLTGNWFFHLIDQHLPFHLPVIAGSWLWVRFFILFGMVFILVVFVYRMSVPRGKPRAPVFTGALIASLALVGASVIFSWFIGVSTSRYSLVYGSLTSVVIMLLWLYISGNVLILGGVFNYVRYRRRLEKKKEKISPENR